MFKQPKKRKILSYRVAMTISSLAKPALLNAVVDSPSKKDLTGVNGKSNIIPSVSSATWAKRAVSIIQLNFYSSSKQIHFFISYGLI